ncbi:hypothetical protein [Photobacterium kishitanii]|uniref:Uncharacterized protein n=1 Tax=Photobacterium kishitanii TaxID=318456 RepID=A0A2T3KLA4_9GAMM|nr:hypothetical protein [Photobacterium kishitanii]PSV00427.1 hypothetical protein C9J27_04665 [Photobacterium kishitanii]
MKKLNFNIKTGRVYDYAQEIICQEVSRCVNNFGGANYLFNCTDNSRKMTFNVIVEDFFGIMSESDISTEILDLYDSGKYSSGHKSLVN